MTLRWAATLLLLAPAAAAGPDDAPTYPARVLLIRHAEKPPEEAAPPDLSPAGRQRADALPKLFVRADGRPDPFPAPDFLFAARDKAKSRRPAETLAPLARALGLPVHADVSSDEPEALARELLRDPKYAGKTVLVCWRHTKLPELAHKLGAPDAPETWADGVFDRVWEIDYDKNGKATFTDRPQRLMPGDSPK